MPIRTPKKKQDKGGKDTIEVACCQFDKIFKRSNRVNDQANTERPEAFCVFSPLQSTKDAMHTVRTTDIGHHKQRIMCSYILIVQHALDALARGYLFTKEKAVYLLLRREFP